MSIERVSYKVLHKNGNRIVVFFDQNRDTVNPDTLLKFINTFLTLEEPEESDKKPYCFCLVCLENEDYVIECTKPECKDWISIQDLKGEPGPRTVELL